LASSFAGCVLLAICFWMNGWPVGRTFGPITQDMTIRISSYTSNSHNPLFNWEVLGHLIVTGLIMTHWFRMMRLETHAHTTHVGITVREGFWYFLVSEAFLFVGFFWAYFHNALAPDLKTGGFPNFRIHTLDAWRVPLFNTMILISSGFTLTWRYHALVLHVADESIFAQVISVIQGFAFSYYQLWEYYECTFTISQRCWRSIFFMATGFHGCHVLIGTAFLIYNIWRSVLFEFSRRKSTRFEMGTWYWHFVDLIWIGLFVFIYDMN